jgi:hypothetical protein
MTVLADRPVTAAGVMVDIVEVDPGYARDLLQKNTRNRRVKLNWVAELSRRLLDGEWRLSWDAIAIDTDGRIQNGQHRLHAIVRANRSAPCLLLVGSLPEVQDIGDGGVKRSVGDQLDLAGEKSANVLGAALKIVYAYTATGVPLGLPATFSTPKAKAVLARNPEIRQSVIVGVAFGRVIKRSSPATFAALHYLFSRVDGADAEAFAQGVIDGDGLVAGDPRLTLRNRLLRHAMSETTQVTERVLATFTIRAWEAWRRGENAGKLQFRASDPFPVITGLDRTMV